MEVPEADRRTEHHLGASDLEDPLEDYSGLSLFPRTVASLSGAPPPPNSNDPYLTHNFLNSMSLHIPEELLEPVKSIIDGSSELPNSRILTADVSKEKSDDVKEQFLGPPRDRRPALGRKRARFSLKPDSSPPKPSFEMAFDIHKLKDPEEFFSAFERFENAKVEMQKQKKQTGNTLIDLDQNTLSMVARSRRPGIARRSAKYKHRYSTGISSQENLEEKIISPSPSKTYHGIDDPNAQLEEKIISPSASKTSHGIDVPNAQLEETDLMVAEAESRVNEILDDLLDNIDEQLDGDKAITLLQRHMQIRPISVGKLVLPDLLDIRRFDNKASEGRLGSPRIMLPGTQTLIKGASSKITQQIGSSVQYPASPTPERSPFTSIPLLRKQISQPTQVPDLFSSDILDQSPKDLGSSHENFDEVHSEDDLSMSDVVRSLTTKGTTTTFAPSEKSKGVITIGVGINADAGSVQNSPSPVWTEILQSPISPREQMLQSSQFTNKTLLDNTDKSLTDSVATGYTHERCDLVDEKNKNSMHDPSKSGTIDGNETTSASSEKSNSDCTGGRGINADVSPSAPRPEIEERFCGTVLENSFRCDDQTVIEVDTNIHTAEPVEITDRVETMQQEVELPAEALLPVDHLSSGQTKSNHSDHVVEENAKDESTKNAKGQGMHTTQKGDRSSKVRVNKQRKAKSRPSRSKRKEVAPLWPQPRSSLLALPACFSLEQKGDLSSEVQVKKPSQALSHPFGSKRKEPATLSSQKGDISSEVQVKKQRKAVSRPSRSKRNELTLRQSLAGYGTEMQSGLRRSTRIRSRPLEYWRGERFLYGRVHASLPTVIGVKYGSPGGGIETPCLKVKSFVPNEYMDLFKRAAALF